MMSNILDTLNARLKSALIKAFGEDFAKVNPMLTPVNNPEFGDYSSNIAMQLAKEFKQSPYAIAQQIIQRLKVSDICEPPEMAGEGFINLRLKPDFVEMQIEYMHTDSQRLGIAKIEQPRKVIIDFSSPNIAKDMHVGHLRSTIIGDALSRTLEFLGYDVLRLNHVGDWGTQFGMLITYLREVYPKVLITADVVDLEDLVTFYRKAKKRFDEDEAFKEAARQAVVELQAGDPDTRRAWELLCDQSRREFQKIYDLLDIRLIERGESFYNLYLPQVIEELDQLSLLKEDEGAKCVYPEGYINKEGEQQPLIVQKSDGGYNYATTDLAAIRYRLRQDQAVWIIYVVDAGQSNHLGQVFQIAKQAEWLPEGVKAVHVPFGLIQGEDGKKLKTRSGETVRLRELLDEAIIRASEDLNNRLIQEGRTETEEFIIQVAQVVGLSSVKYADLSQNRNSNYVFSFNKMLTLQGNTAPYLLYAYARIQGIIRKENIDLEQLGSNPQILLQEESELALAKHLLRLNEILSEIERELLPNRLCLYLFELSQKFNQFYEHCPVLKAKEPLRTSRLILSNLTARTLKLGLSLLGIPVLERM